MQSSRQPTSDEVFAEMSAGVQATRQKTRRRFLPGLLVAFIDLVRTVRPAGQTYASLTDFYQDFPLREQTREGGKANTLIIQRPDGSTPSLRPAYQRFEAWVRDENRRFDYPSMAPHATQAWRDYEHWLACLVAMNDTELEKLEDRIRLFTLDAFASYENDSGPLKREPPRFYRFMRDFDFSKRVGPTGAAYQGAVFAWIRADAPHLQVQVAKEPSIN